MSKRKTESRTIHSRYGDPRVITPHGSGWYTMEGPCHYYRVGMNENNTDIAYFDPDGGPFVSVGDDSWAELGGRKIVSLCVEDPGKEKHFKIRIEVEQ